MPKFLRHPLSILLVGAIILSFVGIYSRFIHLGPNSIGLWRMALGLPFLFIYRSFDRKTPYPKLTAKDKYLLGFLGLIFGIDIVLWQYALSYTEIAMVGSINAMTPIYVGLFSLLFFRKELSWKFWLGALLTTAGGIMLIEQHAKIQLDRMHLLGDFIAVGCSIIYALYIIGIKRLSKSYHPIQILIAVQLMSSAVLALGTVVAGEHPIPYLLSDIFWIVVLALAGQTLGYLFINYGVEKIKLTFATLILMLEPVLGSIAAWILFAESLVWQQIVGIGIILVGIYIAKTDSIIG